MLTLASALEARENFDCCRHDNFFPCVFHVRFSAVFRLHYNIAKMAESTDLQAQRKKHMPPFSVQEQLALMNAYDARKDTLLSRCHTQYMRKKKDEAWAEIAQALNS